MKSKFLLGWFISILQSLSSVALLATSAWLLSRADQRPSVMYLSIAVVGVRAFALGKAFFRYSERLVLHDATFRKATFMRTAIYEKLVDRAPIGLSGNTMGSLLNTLVNDTEEALNLDLRYRPALIQSIAVSVAGACIYLWLVPQYAWLMILVLAFGAGLTYFGSRQNIATNLRKLSELRSELSELTTVLVSRSKVIRAYGWQNRSNEMLNKLSEQVSKAELQLANSSGLLQSFIAMAMYLTILAAVLVSSASGTLLPGEQVAVLVLLPLAIFEYLQALPNAFQARFKAEVAIDRLEELRNAQISSELISGGEIQLDHFERMSLNDVSVRYPYGQLVKLPNFEMRSSESLALVAKSGAGKTTLANVLVGFIRNNVGNFKLNDSSIAAYDPNSLRKVIGLVEQQPIILAGTVRDNLLLANESSTDQELITVLHEVNLWQMLEARNGLDTEVGAYGSRLSGGEIQRLALARNFLAKRELIVLDEPTSSVSREQGLSLVKQFVVLAKERRVSIILITHDRELAKLAGRLVEF